MIQADKIIIKSNCYKWEGFSLAYFFPGGYKYNFMELGIFAI